MEKKAIDLLKKYTKHEQVRFTSRGNKAIFAAFKCAKKLNPGKYILVPDQGGWFTFLNYPKKLGFEVKSVKTNYGIIDLDDLKNKLKDASALIYTNPAGYFAEQPLKKIYDVCKKKCLVILDVSGSIGNTKDGSNADIMLGSFGRWKPVNIEYGGFISFKDEKNYIQSKEILNELYFDNTKLEISYGKLKNIKNRYSFFHRINKKIKKDLKDFNILHKDKEGINVVVAFSDEKEKEKLICYCEKNKYEFTLCPRYIRVNEKAISIEVKRMEEVK